MPTQNVTPTCSGHLQEIADVLLKAKKVVVVTGAGISTNLGIPDFRSENGLYALIQAQYDAAAASAAAEKDRIAREELKRSVSLAATTSSSIPDLPGTTLPTMPIMITPSTRVTEPSIMKTRSKSIFETQSTRIFTRSQSDFPRRATFEDPELLLRRALSTQSSHSRSQTPTLRRAASFNATASDLSTTSNPSSKYQSRASSRKPRLQRTASCAPTASTPPIVSSTPASLDTKITTKIATLKRSHKRSRSLEAAPVPQRTSKRIKLLCTPTTPLFTPSESSTSKDPSPDPETSEPASQASISSTTRAVLPKLKGKDLFDAMVWQDPLTTSIFLTFIAELRKQVRTEVVGTSEAHKLVKALRDGGKLVRCYTQNIDGLESREGLCTSLASGTGQRSRFFAGTLSKPRLDDGRGTNSGGVEVVQLHGGLDFLRCSLCGEQSAWSREKESISSEGHINDNSTASTMPTASSTTSSAPASATVTTSFGTKDNTPEDDDDDAEQSDREEVLRGGKAPGCQRCIRVDEARQHRGRRSVAVGKLRPDVVLYGEEHPEATQIGELVTHDISLSPDVLLIMGTSLRVHGLKVLVREFARATHAKGGKVIFVNNTKPPESTWGDVLDYWVEMDCDRWVGNLKERRGELWLPQGLPVEPKKSEESIARRNKLDSKKVAERKSLPGSSRSTPATKKPKIATAVSEPKPAAKRPQCQREDEMNGAYWAYQIQLNLEIIGGRPRTYAPLCNPHRKWGKEKWRRDSGKGATLSSTAPSALKSISSNVPRPIKAARARGKSDIGVKAAGPQLQREFSATVVPTTRSNLLLPTPPPSDETSEPELPPLTPRTRERIKSDSSIERILSSPIARRTRSQ